MNMSDLTPNEREEIGLKLKQLVKNSGYKQETIAEICGFSSTRSITKIFNGETVKSTDTVMKICNEIGMEFDSLFEDLERFSKNVDVSAEQYGPYTKNYAENYIGRYLLLRRAYTIDQCAIGSIIDIRWSNKQQCLKFQNSNDLLDYDQPITRVTHGGAIYMSEHIGLLHMLKVHGGAIRSTTLSKIRDNANMSGATLTQASLDFHHQVAVTPVYFAKMTEENYDEMKTMLGQMLPDTDSFDQAIFYLNKVSSSILGLNSPELVSQKADGYNILDINNKPNNKHNF